MIKITLNQITKKINDDSKEDVKTNLKEDLRSKNILENGVEAQKLKHLEIEETIFGQINFEMK